MKFQLDQPEHGWVPVRLTVDDIDIEFVASDVPNDPVAELISALHSAVVGHPAHVWWHLEPDGWYFEFEPLDSLIQLRVLFARHSQSTQAQEILRVEGSREEVLVPLWRGLRRFETYDPAPPHWPKVPAQDLQKLTEALKHSP